MESVLAQLIEMVSETAPEVWRLARQQVVVQTVAGILTYTFFTIVLGIVVKTGINWLKKPLDNHGYNSDRDFDRLIVGMGFIIGMTVWMMATGFGLFRYIVPRLLNPDWYAIEALRSLLP